MRDEQDLIQRAISNPDAFLELYHRYFRRIYAYVAARIGNRQDAEDVVSEIFLRVIKNLAQLRNHHHVSFAAWIFMIARNNVTDFYRRNGRTENLIPLDDAPPIAIVEANPEHITSMNEDARRIYACILALPERKREIVTLRYYGGLRNQEIAEVLGIGEKTVSAHLSRALRELQETVERTTHDV